MALRGTIAKVPAGFADGFARVVRSAPDSRLEQILRTPVRRAVLDGIFWQIPQHLDRQAAAGIDSTIRWRIISPANMTDTYELALGEAGRCRVRRGESSAEPRLTITLGAVEFVKLVTGNSDPMQAYFKGRIKLGGDIMLAAKLQSLFRIPGRNRVAQPKSTVSSSR